MPSEGLGGGGVPMADASSCDDLTAVRDADDFVAAAAASRRPAFDLRGFGDGGGAGSSQNESGGTSFQMIVGGDDGGSGSGGGLGAAAAAAENIANAEDTA